MNQNRYVEYSKWALFWGLFLSSEKEVQKLIDEHNKSGWTVVQFQWTAPKWSIVRVIGILLVTIITIGFVSYWSGFSIIFEKKPTEGIYKNSTPDYEYLNWKKKQPQ